MPSIEELIIAKLSEDHHRLWTKAFAAAATQVLARRLLASFDPTSGRFLGGLPPVNNLLWRVHVLNEATDLVTICESKLMEEFDALNESIIKGLDNLGRPYDRRTKPRMRKHLGRVRAALMATPVSSGIVATVAAIDIWRATADELASRVHQQLLSGSGLPDSTLHNHLLIAGYFWVCNLPDEGLVRNELENFAASMLSVQGTLVDIVERVSPDGVKDRRLSIRGASARVSLHHQSLSPLLDSLVNETRNVASGQGFLMRWLGAIKTDTSAKVDPALMHRLRASAYPQYEYSVLAVMALSGIEQILRAFAHRVGMFDGQKRFTPARLAAIVTALGNSAAVEDAIKRVYDNEQGNLRNRILHGAQLQIARSQQQSTISVANPVMYPKAPDAFSPENVFSLCMEALQTLDTHIAKIVTLTPNDLAWTRHLELSSQEILFGRSIHYDFVGEEGKLWWERIDDFLTAVSPNIKILFDVGFMGWIDRKRPERLVLFMALNMIVEALFRVNVRLHSGNIIKRSSPEIGEGPIVLRYKMLDQHELCSDETLDRLVESVEPASRELAKKALTLAVKVRDAVAHGAVPTLEQDDVEMGHLLVKSIQCLVEAGEHEMIKTAAYYEWQVRPERDALSNWLAGERQILDQIQSRTRQPSVT
jgi:hypothetical protein